MPYQRVEGYRINVGPVHLSPILGREVKPGEILLTGLDQDQYDSLDFGIVVTEEEIVSKVYRPEDVKSVNLQTRSAGSV